MTTSAAVLVSALYVVGLVLPVVGLVRAYRGVRKALNKTPRFDNYGSLQPHIDAMYRNFRDSLQAARNELWWVGGGLLSATIASVAGVWLSV